MNFAVQDGVQGLLPAYRGTVHALRSMVAEEGWRSLYGGLTPALIGAGIVVDQTVSGEHLALSQQLNLAKEDKALADD